MKIISILPSFLEEFFQYLQEEKQLLPARAEQNFFAVEIAELNRQIEKLETSLKELQNKL